MSNNILDAYIANALTELALVDLLYIGDDPAGTPADGAIAFSDLITQLGGLLYNAATVTTANVTAVENNHYDLTIAGLTAERKFTLPTPSKAGVKCSFRILDGDATYSIMPTANAVDLDGYNLFIAGESLIFRSTGTGAGDWEVADGGDGRKPSGAGMSNTVVQSGIVTATQTQVEFNSDDFDIGGLSTLASESITVRRENIYDLEGFLMINLDDQKKLSVFLQVGGVDEVEGDATSSAAATNTITARATSTITLTVGQVVTMEVEHDQGANRSTVAAARRPRLIVKEQL